MSAGLGTNDIETTATKKELGNFLRVFSGLVLASFDRSSKTINRHVVATISSGSGAAFPVIDRADAFYLEAGKTLTDTDVIKNGTVFIKIDGYLTASTRVFSIENTMNSFNIKPYYSKVLGEALAVGADKAILNEVINMVLPSFTIGIDFSKELKEDSFTGKIGTRFDQTSSIVLVQEKKGAPSSQSLGKLILQGLAEAQEKLYKNYVPESERYFYISPTGYASLLSALLPTSANYSALINAEKGTLTNIMGFEIIQVPFLSSLADGVGGTPVAITDTSKKIDAQHKFTATGLTGDHIIGIFHHKEAVATVKLQGLKMEQGRIVEQLADQMVAYYAMGHGGLRPEAAGLMLFAKIPTS